MASVYTYTETYGDSDILIEVERDMSTTEIDGVTVPLHQITAYIDDVLEITDYNPTSGYPPAYPPISDRLTEILQILKDQIDGVDELDEILEALGYSEGSEGVLDYVVTSPSTGVVTHTWTADPDFANLEIEQASLPDYSDAANIYEGTLTSPISDTGITSGLTLFFRIRGQRSGEGFGPWSNQSIIVS